MAGGGKGGGGMPQGQGKGMGGAPQAQGGTPQDMAQKLQQANAAGATMPAGVGDPRAADMMAQRQMLMQRNAMGGMGQYGRPGQGFNPMGGGIAGLAGMNRADFMPGGALAAPLDLASAPAWSGVNPSGALPANAPTGTPPPQMNMDAMNRMRSQAYGGMGGGGGYGMGGRFGGFGGYGGSRGRMGYGGMGGMMDGRGMMPQQQPMANGGIVSLAGGGRLGEPISRGGVTYAPAATASVAPLAAAPVAAAAAPRVAWTPGATAPAAGGGMFSGINMAPITAPAAFVAKPQAAIWQPPVKAAAPAGATGYQIPGSQRTGPLMGNWLMEAKYAQGHGATPEQLQQIRRRAFSGGMRGSQR